MDWKKFIVRFLRNVIVFTALSTLLLGVFGYFLSGREGFINMAAWGIALGLVGSFSSGLAMLLNTEIWSGYSRRYGESCFRKDSEGEDDPDTRR